MNSVNGVAAQVPALDHGPNSAHGEWKLKPLALSIEGMSCASCVGRVERALARLDAVESVEVNLASERAMVEVLRDTAPENLISAIEAAGYQARLISPEQTPTMSVSRQSEASKAQLHRLKREMALAATLAIPVFLLDMSAHFFPTSHGWWGNMGGVPVDWLLQCVLATIVLCFPGRRFYRAGIPALLRGAPDMNSLVALGTLAAYVYSLVATLAPQWLPGKTSVSVYFEAVSLIVTLVLAGRTMELRARGQTSDAIRHLVGLQPRSARVVRSGVVCDVALADIVIGDVLEIRPGERFAADGVIVEGCSFVDESMISGEAIPVAKEQGAPVTGGTVNQNGVLKLRVTAIGSDSVLARIIGLVEQAQGAKLPIQALVDRITMWFVPTILILAIFTFVAWLCLGPQPAVSLALVHGVSVLIIACPCAMGLATPVSIMVGTGSAARSGILFRNGAALQMLSQARIIAFDKTGTLTEGKPELTDLYLAAAFERSQVLSTIAGVEFLSEHPLALAIVAAAKAENLPLPVASDFQSLPGRGVRAMVGGQKIEIGSASYMQSLGLDIEPFAAIVALLAGQGKSPVHVAIDGKLAAALAVSDTLRPSAAAAIAALHGLGLKTAMISGDHQATARAIARQLGMDHVCAQMTPAEKLVQVKSLQERYGCLAYVGDGINDAPALAQADVGIAIGSGTDVAIEAAGVVLISENLAAVSDAILVSKATMTNIRQNLFWAFFYNVALIPLAAGVLVPTYGISLSPVFAAAAMALSSVFVLLNALRLRRFASPRNRQ